MPKAEPVTRCDFFVNAAALEAGLTQQFWYQAYLQFLEDAENDTSTPGFERYDIARTVRIPFHQNQIDVLVRCQPEPRECRIIRLTAFSIGDERQTSPLSRWYGHLDESRTVVMVVGRQSLHLNHAC